MKVRNYIKSGNRFIPLKQYESIVPNQDYIEGAIEIEQYGKIIFSVDYWDYIDELWNYFFDGLILVNQGKSFSTNLPDQPIEITFTAIGKHTIRFAIIEETTYSMDIPKKIFFDAMLAAFTEFIDYLPTIAPRSIGWSSSMKSELKKSGLQK